MARLFPKLDPAQIENRAEREIYQQLKAQLPATWSVRYSFSFCWHERNFLRDAEIDFVIVAPDRGVLVVEVKGSRGYDCRDGTWYRVNDEGIAEEARNPFTQASTTKHRLIERIARRIFGVTKNDFPGIFGHVVIYPFARSKGRLPDSIEPCVMLTYEDVPALHERIEEAFKQWGGEGTARLFNRDRADRVVAFLSEETSLVTVLAADADVDERSIHNLTRQQYNAFRGIDANPRVHVTGPAGSGKTLLAAWGARARAAAGERVLFLCFNRVLAAWLSHQQTRDPSPGTLEIRSFFSICQEIVRRAGLEFAPPSEGDEEKQDFWNRVAPSLFCNALERLPESSFPRYDAVFVDEAQDFHEDWWIPVQLLLKDPNRGRLSIFSDPEQTGVYGRGQARPEPLVLYGLRENCRNTRRIAAYCGRILTVPVEHFPDCPEGVVPTILEPSRDPKVRAALVRQELVRLMQERFSAARIAVLSPWRRGSPETCLNHLGAVNNKQLAGGEGVIPDWNAGRVIWSSTTKSFKGLEADCVILADAPSPCSGCGLADLYVAASRAKHVLIVSPVDETAAEIYRGWQRGRE